MQNYYLFCAEEFQDFPRWDVCRWRWLERCTHHNTLRPFSQQLFTTTGLNLRARRDNAGEKPQQCPLIGRCEPMTCEAVFISPTVGSSSAVGTSGTESNVLLSPNQSVSMCLSLQRQLPVNFPAGIPQISSLMSLRSILKSSNLSRFGKKEEDGLVVHCSRKHDSNTVTQQIQEKKKTEGNVKTCLKP